MKTFYALKEKLIVRTSYFKKCDDLMVIARDRNELAENSSRTILDLYRTVMRSYFKVAQFRISLNYKDI